ncbi:MAG TPA: S9 family peptidase [Bdellovibrionales bacterium]|nr:S9 family peptidase [Bdellovibrionales bacterium]
MNLHDYFNRINVFPPVALSDDGTKLAYISSVTGSPQVWVGDISGDGPMAYPKPLTFAKDEQPHVMDASLEWIGDDRLVVQMDRHGDEMTFIRVLNVKTGEKIDIPEEKGARDHLGFTSSDKKTYYFASSRGHRKTNGLYAFDVKSRKVRKLAHRQDRSLYWTGAYRHGNQIFVIGFKQSRANSLHLIDPKTGRVRDLHTDPNTILQPIGDSKNDVVPVISDIGRQFMSLGKYNMKSRQIEYLQPDKWDVEEAKFTPDGKRLLVNRNVAGRSVLELYRWPSMKREKISFKTNGTVTGLEFAKSGKFAVFTFNSPAEPRNLYKLDMKTRKCAALTDNWTSPLAAGELVHPEIVTYKSAVRGVHGFFFKPKGAKKNGRLPVIVWPHGGPQWQERAIFRPILQYFVARGFAVWTPNPSGSTGYGREYCDAIRGAWGTADLEDQRLGIEWLKKSGWIDPNKIAIMGGSYGGYMTLRAITRFPKTFKAAVDIFGVSNLITFVSSVPEDWRLMMDELVGNPERDAERLREQSPVFELDKIDCPLFVIQGARDPRVVQAESDQIVGRMREMKKAVEYLVFEDEGHGFLKLDNELKAFQASAEFIEKALS